MGCLKVADHFGSFDNSVCFKTILINNINVAASLNEDELAPRGYYMHLYHVILVVVLNIYVLIQWHYGIAISSYFVIVVFFDISPDDDYS